MEVERNMDAECLGDYRILGYLGKNIWCQEILAEHRFIKKRYRLLLLHSEYSSSQEFMRVFYESVSKLASMKHPSLLSIENVSQVEDKYFLVTEERTIPLVSLSQYLADHPEGLPELEVRSIVSQLAEVLDYAHSQGLVHGNLHLHSVFVDLSGESLRVVLPELGFSFLLRDAYMQQACQESLHKEGMLRLRERILFQAPETASGSAAEDVYAFGVLVYALLFNCLPQGKLFVSSEVFPEYIYDWDALFCSCLHYHAENRPKKLASALMKKTFGERFLNIKTQCTEGVREMISEEPSLHFESMKEAATQMIEQDQPAEKEFVLVEAKSIDEAMNTSIESSEANSEESYSYALHSLLSREPVVSRYIEEEKEEVASQPLFTEMVFIEGGEFTRGSLEGQRDEHPLHSVTLKSFFLDIHPVTNEQFVRYLEYVGSEQDTCYNELICLKDSRIQRRSGKLVIETGYARHPVVGVTWYGAAEYAAWVGKRLPTEAEWEVAAGGGVQSRYPCGEEIDKTMANFFSSDTTEVMSYPANVYGLYDMAGNVYEWCYDWYGYNFYEVSAQESYCPVGPLQGVYRVLRGGCWKSLKDDLRCAHRHRNNPGVVNSTYGFRCAKGVK